MKHYRTESSLGSILGIQINRTINPGTMRDANLFWWSGNLDKGNS